MGKSCLEVPLPDAVREFLQKPTLADRDDPYRYVQIRGRVVKIDRTRGAADIERLSLRYRGRPYQYPSTDGPANRLTLLIEPRRIHTMGIR